MNNMTPYTYTILRYIHDTTTGEFINVGVALHCPEKRYASALCRTTYSRLSKVFPGMNPDHFKSLMRHVQSSFEEFGENLFGNLDLEPVSSIMEIARKIIPADDSSLQWAPMGAGKANDPATTLEKLFERMVMQYEERHTKERRTEDEVWRHFKHNLESRQLLQHFEPATISVQDDEIEFQHTWRNGALHCLEPLSFDLSSPETIKDKAHRWLGRMTSVAESTEQFKVYFLVGQPQEQELSSAFESALSILKKIPDIKIFREQESNDLAEQIALQIEQHEADISHSPFRPTL